MARSFAILEALATAPGGGGAAANDLAAVLKIHRNGVLRILESLRDLGYVRYDGARELYSLEPRLYLLGLAAARVDLLPRARPHLRRLSDAAEESVELVILDGDQFQVIDTVNCLGSLHLGVRTGMRLPLWRFAGGRVLLAGQSDSTVADWLQQNRLGVDTNSADETPAAVLAEIARVRRTGFARCVQLKRPEIERIAAPIFDLRGEVIAAVGIAGLHSSLTVAGSSATIVKQIQAAAAAISQDLGWHPDGVEMRRKP
ncbi:MAG TPA: IclR family transcriptional regulator [Planctomycetota bacterium]|nr:IclR family transcriptional regulator [Planctomycetota bacterium]